MRIATSADMPRVAQLTEKTIQYNLSLKRRSEAELGNLSDDHVIDVMEVTDRLDDYRLVRVCILMQPSESSGVVGIDQWSRPGTKVSRMQRCTGQTTTSPPNDSPPHALRDLNFGRIDQISSHVYRRERYRRQMRGTTGIIARTIPVNMPMKWAVFAIGPNTPKTHIPAKNNVYCTWSRPMWTP